MDTNAPGQLLGYTMQYPRALYHLLLCGEDDSICIEVVGDVATLKNDGSRIVEEDKSSLVGNVLTDKSTDFWKTFHNWISAIQQGDIQVENTRFLLYTNQKGRRSLVNEFNDADSLEKAQAAVLAAATKLGKLDKKHEAWPYFEFCVVRNPLLLSKVIRNFELQIVQGGTGFEDVKKELRRMMVPETQIEFFLENISGWIQKEVVKLISNKEPSIISRKRFRLQFESLFDRMRKRELIDFALELPNLEGEKKKALKIRPCYIRQLDKINLSDDEILEAVADYLKAKVNRDKWIEYEIIDQEIADDFEKRLVAYWKNQIRKIEIIEKASSPEEKGQLLYYYCKDRQEPIRDMTPPAATIAGTYHALADGPVLGWHLEWEAEFKK